ncbi:hypothetical protein OIO90_000626 [Microbotryomycetes sp. JL221]|nr:hypothetical protein OIO90_000626 [Microbotryomycetes sp. JL221]
MAGLLPAFEEHQHQHQRQLQHQEHAESDSHAHLPVHRSVLRKMSSLASLKSERQRPSALPQQQLKTPSTSFRPRSSSMHQPSMSQNRIRALDAPDLPPLPSMPPTPAQADRELLQLSQAQRQSTTFSGTSKSSSGSGGSFDMRARPLIKSVNVTHSTKTGKSWAFACRVIPDASNLAELNGVVSSDLTPSSTTSANNLGRMAMAGRLEYELREPYTVWRTWGEFVDLSSRLANLFPVVSAADHGISSSALPSSFYRQVPRLSKKITLFVTRSTLAQRQAELDVFTRRLFEMPEQVCQSRIVRDFFVLREDDIGTVRLTSNTATATSAASSTNAIWGEVAGEEPESFASFLAGLESPNATVKPHSSKTRPQLHAKMSTPNLRTALLRHDIEAERPPMPRAATELPSVNTRASIYSVSTTASTSSSATVTPSSFAAASAAMSIRAKSPLANEEPSSEVLTSVPVAESEQKPKRRPRLGPLRHFRSLQDLRSEKSPPAYPSEPMPKRPGSRSMARAVTQPHAMFDPSSPTTSAEQSSRAINNDELKVSPTTSNRLVHARRRSGSKGSASSFEDLWGTSGQIPATSTDPGPVTFRRTPSGRIDRVVPDGNVRPRRPSMPTRMSTSGVTTRATTGHASTPSTSSVGSSRSSFAGSSMDLSRSYSGHRSHRSSVDYSGSDIGTPQTPHSEFAPSSKGSVDFTSSYSQMNKVPLAPFFPVPPQNSSVMEAAYSHEGMPHTPKHRRKGSLEQRARTGSTTSRRPLDTIIASPKGTSPGPTPPIASPSIAGGATTFVTFKLLHPQANLVLRTTRHELTLQSLRTQIRHKFCSADVVLESESAHWGLAYTKDHATTVGNGSGEARTTRLIITEEDLRAVLDGVTSSDKLTFRVVS